MLVAGDSARTCAWGFATMRGKARNSNRNVTRSDVYEKSRIVRTIKRRLGLTWEMDRKNGPSLFGRHDIYSSFVRVDDTICDVEAQTQVGGWAGGLGRRCLQLHRVEDPIELIFGNWRSVIVHSDRDLIIVPLDVDRHRTAFRAMLHLVAQQI